MYQFNYHRPTTIAEARALHEKADDGLYLAGGHTLIPAMKQRLSAPSDVIDLSGITEMRGIIRDGDSLVIGALTPHAEVAASDVVRRHSSALTDLAEGIGDLQVRNRGTIGGSIANNDPAADYPAAIVGLAATVHTDQREISGDDFFTGMFETELAPGEVIISIRFPAVTRAAYEKFPNPASRYATVGVMVAEVAGEVRVAITGAASSVFRATDFESALTGSMSVDALKEVSVAAGLLMSDLHASAEYRAQLCRIMARNAVARVAAM
jgi:carbon-monoxide dehydrogenase medium subunit